MANGTLKDEATYFNDAEKYVGDSGSETNMWVVEDSYDFIEVANLYNSDTVYIRLVSDIDFNEHETYKRGFINKSFESETSRNLYGDGHKIKNIVSISNYNSVFTFNHIEDCDFVNMVLISTYSFPISILDESEASVEGCNFGVYLSDSDFSPYADFTDCTFNVKGILRDNAKIYLAKAINQCHFNFDVKMNAEHIFYTPSGVYYFTNSHVTGKIENSYDDSNVWLDSNLAPQNSYFAFELILPNNNPYLIFNGTGFVDEELLGQEIYSATDGFYTLTTAQAKDADYLNSIGFPVISVE